VTIGDDNDGADEIPTGDVEDEDGAGPAAGDVATGEGVEDADDVASPGELLSAI